MAGLTGAWDWERFLRDEALRGKVAERAVRPLGVVIEPEVLDDDTGLGQGPKLLAVKAFVAQAGVVRLDKVVLPRARQGDVDGSDFLFG